MKKNEQIERAETVIKNDRITLKEDFINLFSSDIESIFKEYFDCNDSPKIEISKNGSGYIVTVSTFCRAVKYFNSLPK